MKNKLSVLFVWHMHQPDYKDKDTGLYLMPWVRLHAVKDYLDMLLILEKYPKIKQTFNLVPILLDQLEDYADNEAHDTYSKLSIKDVNDLSDADKYFILQHFFDANYDNMIAPYRHYAELYEKRYNLKEIDINAFSLEEYSDIMAWYNLVWFDPYWVYSVPDIEALFDKKFNYTLEDRKRIIEIQRIIIRQIIPTYREYVQKGKIEISTSPYYHPILPLMNDVKSAKKALPNIILPESSKLFKDDIIYQLKMAKKRIKEAFGIEPKGLWPPEHGISPETLKMAIELGFDWTITDECILSSTLKKEFIRDFQGFMQDPYDLSKVYNFKHKNSKINIFFRNAFYTNLINFEYSNHSPDAAANDLYERIKTMQNKLEYSPDSDHAVVIALDGENCWESYTKDGMPFLESIYSLLSDDNSLEVITVSEHLEKTTKDKELKTIYEGSWVNSNFQLWIGDDTKNTAWEYLAKTRENIEKIIKNGDYSQDVIDEVYKELYVAQGSDWFWWYGDPNDSGQDELFDKLFRNHLINAYKLLKKQAPKYLKMPLETYIGRLSKDPLGLISPSIDGILDESEWINAGCIERKFGPVYRQERVFNKFCYGNDNNNVYFMFDLNVEVVRNVDPSSYIYLYFQTNNLENYSPVRFTNPSENISAFCVYRYSHEVEIAIIKGEIMPLTLSESIHNYLWKVKMNNNLIYYYQNALEISIPFDDLGVKKGDEIFFAVFLAKNNILEEILPNNQAICIKRP